MVMTSADTEPYREPNPIDKSMHKHQPIHANDALFR